MFLRLSETYCMGFFSISMTHYNESRDEAALKELRPVLPLEELDQLIENFQNQVLRPVLKMQNDVLLDLLLMQPNVDSVIAHKGKRTVFSERLRIFIQQPILRGALLGCVLGCLTREELKVYKTNTKEFNKRIFQMTLHRLVDSF